MKIFFCPDYIAAGHSFDTTRKAGWVAESLQKSPMADVTICAPETVSIPELQTIHDAQYVSAIEAGTPRSLAESQGFSWDACLWKAVCASTGGAVASALTAMKEGVSGSLSSGLHHARRKHGAGFCTFNGLALAVEAALTAGAQSVLILDLDAHCGGGTYSLIENWNGVRQMDVSVDSFDFYKPALPHTLDLIREADAYLPTIEARLRSLGGQAFDLCLYNAGMDPFERCSIGGLKGITGKMLAAREHMVFQWAAQRNLPIAFVLEGGYIGAELQQDELVQLHRLTATEAGKISAAAGNLR